MLNVFVALIVNRRLFAKSTFFADKIHVNDKYHILFSDA